MRFMGNLGFVATMAVAIAAASVNSPAIAHPVSGQMSATFGNPVLSGQLVDGATGAISSLDNTSTAVFSGIGTSTFIWGTGGAAINHSTLTFVPSTLASQAPNTPFVLGQITYTNGTSTLASLVFGVDMTFSVPSDPSVNPLIAHVKLVTTNNTGTAAQNADFIGFDIFPNTFNVLEGVTSSANLIGKINGDPNIALTDIALTDPNDPNGFIGQGRPLPEPASLALFGLAAIVTGAVRLRGKAHAARP